MASSSLSFFSNSARNQGALSGFAPICLSEAPPRRKLTQQKLESNTVEFARDSETAPRVSCHDLTWRSVLLSSSSTFVHLSCAYVPLGPRGLLRGVRGQRQSHGNPATSTLNLVGTLRRRSRARRRAACDKRPNVTAEVSFKRASTAF